MPHTLNRQYVREVMSNRHLIQPGSRVNLAQISTSGKDFCKDRREAENEFKDLRHEFIDLQSVLYAESKRSLLIVLQAIDAGGKDSAIRKMTAGTNPQGVEVASFKRPTSLELSHDFLWRIHQRCPAKGMVGVFNRSHYEDVLVVRVDEIVPKSVWKPRYEVINQFENHLVQSGTTILKFFLHISKDEQKARFQDRLDRPEKHWKFEAADLEKRAQWDEYQVAFEDMLQECSTDHAAWHVIPADQKWYRDLALMKVVVKTLKDMAPQFPEAADVKGIVIDQ